MTSITITYDYNNDADINETLEVLVALGELNYCVEKRPSKGSLQLKKVHQEVVSITDLERIAAAEQKITDNDIIITKPGVEFEGLTKSSAAKELPQAPIPQVHRVGKDYIVAYSKYDAICHVSNAEDRTYSEKEKEYKLECSPLTSHEALFNTDFIGKQFGDLLNKKYPAGLPTEWIEGESYFRLPFNLVIENMNVTEPRFLAHLDKINGLERVFYRAYIGKTIEAYLSAKGK